MQLRTLLFIRVLLAVTLALHMPAASSKQSNYFDRLYELMIVDEQIEKVETEERARRKASAIADGCMGIKYLPTQWKEDFSKRYRVNVRSIRFLGAYLRGRTYQSCIVKSSSDRGVCNHRVIFRYTEPFSFSKIDTKCE